MNEGWRFVSPCSPPSAAPMPAVSRPTAANPPAAQSQSPPFIGRSHSRAPHEPCRPPRRSRYKSRAARRSRGPKTTALAAKNHITTGSAPVAETSIGTASRVVRNSSRAPTPNSAAEPSRPSGGIPYPNVVPERCSGQSRRKISKCSSRFGRGRASRAPLRRHVRRASFVCLRSIRGFCSLSQRPEEDPDVLCQ